MSTISITFQVSEECRKNEAAKTGESGPAERTLVVNLSDLSQARRKAILSIADVKPDGDFALRLDWDRTKTLILRDEPHGYGHDVDNARPNSWLDRQELIFDETPTAEVLVARVSEIPHANHGVQEAAEKLAEPYQAKVAATQAAAVENEQRHQAEYERMRPLLEQLIAAEDLDRVSNASCVPGSVERPGWYNWSYHPRAENSLSYMQDEAYNALRRKRGEAEKTAWITEHGSDHLKRAHTAGYDCQRLYVIERAALEAPGFTVDFNDSAEWKSRSCPSTEALDEAEAAKELDLGESSVVWLTEQPNAKRIETGEYFEIFGATEAVVIEDFLGKYDLVKII